MGEMAQCFEADRPFQFRLSGLRSKRRLNRSNRKKQLQLVKRHCEKAELFVIAFSILVLCIDEDANSACYAVNFDEPVHCCRKKDFSKALPLIPLGDGQPA